MADFEFCVGAAVRVAPTKKDPGGEGAVTSRDFREDADGAYVSYRVKIPGHALQVEKQAYAGFWYRADVVSRVT